ASAATHATSHKSKAATCSSSSWLQSCTIWSISPKTIHNESKPPPCPPKRQPGGSKASSNPRALSWFTRQFDVTRFRPDSPHNAWKQKSSPTPTTWTDSEPSALHVHLSAAEASEP